MSKWGLIGLVVLAAVFAAVAAQAADCQKFVGNGYTVEVCVDDVQPTPTDTPAALPPTATPIPPTPTAQPPTATAVPPTPTPTDTPTATPTATPDGPGPVSLSGIWVSPAELSALPMSGPAWSDLLSYASRSCTPDLSNQDDACNVIVMAKALAFARTGQTAYRDGAINAVRTVTTGNTESGGRTLALGRELAAYVIAADLIDLKTADPSLDTVFRAKLRELLTKTLDSKTLISCHEGRPNNWGTMCGGSRAAVAVYLGDQAMLDRVALVFEGYLGDRGAYAGFDYGDLSWQCDASSPVGINPTGCTKSGHSIDGALPEEMRRAGGFTWPPGETGYAWEGLQGVVVQAEILHRAGYPAWQWSDRAVCRAVQFLYSIGWQPSGDDPWQIPLVNLRCGTSYAVSSLGSPGKIAGFTGYTHQSTAGALIVPQAQMAPALATEQRIVVDSDPVALAEEVDYLTSLGWRAVGNVQQTTNDAGEPVYSQVVER